MNHTWPRDNNLWTCTKSIGVTSLLLTDHILKVIDQWVWRSAEALLFTCSSLTCNVAQSVPASCQPLVVSRSGALCLSPAQRPPGLCLRRRLNASVGTAPWSRTAFANTAGRRHVCLGAGRCRIWGSFRWRCRGFPRAGKAVLWYEPHKTCQEPWRWNPLIAQWHPRWRCCLS